MKSNKTMISVFTLGLVLAAAPLFAQKGLGAGVGLGTQAQVGAGTAVQAGGANVGVSPKADVHANTSAQRGTTGAVAGANIGARIENNPQMATRVQGLLPSGESIGAASAGFKNEGQFLAALHASNNLSIPFDDLKAKMTGSDSMSLGAAIHALKPQMKESEAKQEAKRADEQAKATASGKVATSASSNTSTTAKTTDKR